MSLLVNLTGDMAFSCFLGRLSFVGLLGALWGEGTGVGRGLVALVDVGLFVWALFCP